MPGPPPSLTGWRSPPPHQPSPGGSAAALPQGRSDPWERGRPARMLFHRGVAELEHDLAGSYHPGGNGNGQPKGELWRRCRLIQVGETAEAVPSIVRARRPRSQGETCGQPGANSY